MSLLVESDPGDLNRQDETNIERESQKEIKSPCVAPPQSGKRQMVTECITLVNKVYENQSLIEDRRDQGNKTKCADSRIPKERSDFVLHARTFRSLSKYKHTR